jgi:hypothetical protein
LLSFPDANAIAVTAGLKCPPEILPPRPIATASAATIRTGTPVKATVPTNREVPKNSTNTGDSISYIYTMDYYDNPGFIRRIPPPRTAAVTTTRESCYSTFPIYEMIYKVLRPGLPRYTFFFKREPYVHSIASDFNIYDFNPWHTASSLNFSEKQMLKDSIDKNIPVLGTIIIHIDNTEAHQIAYLARSNGDTVQVILFETYDTAKLIFKRNVQWKQSLGERVKEITGKISKVESVVPRYTDIQQDDPDDEGRCVMWSLIFLSYLRDLPNLQTATLSDFNKIYDDINEKNKTQSGFANLTGRVFGARRTRKVGVKRIKTRKSGKQGKPRKV